LLLLKLTDGQFAYPSGGSPMNPAPTVTVFPTTQTIEVAFADASASSRNNEPRMIAHQPTSPSSAKPTQGWVHNDFVAKPAITIRSHQAEREFSRDSRWTNCVATALDDPIRNTNFRDLATIHITDAGEPLPGFAAAINALNPLLNFDEPAGQDSTQVPYAINTRERVACKYFLGRDSRHPQTCKSSTCETPLNKQCTNEQPGKDRE